ncbi:hypothetical protein Q3G72_012956 [Acer saccharum]|nr:hypothetical protein Q3G72_012956 [Acer saccharum]
MLSGCNVNPVTGVTNRPTRFSTLPLLLSFTIVPCRSTISNLLDNHGCHADKRHYEVKYGDRSYTKGTLLVETLTIGQMVIRNMAIGCGHKNQGTFSMADGLLGVGCGSMSFVNQLSPQTGGAFSYCLVTWDSDLLLHVAKQQLNAPPVWGLNRSTKDMDPHPSPNNPPAATEDVPCFLCPHPIVMFRTTARPILRLSRRPGTDGGATRTTMKEA